MIIKFKMPIESFDYIGMFDLASKKTGFCLWDIKKHIPVYTRQLIVKNSEELPVHGLNSLIKECLSGVCSEFGIDQKRLLIYKEAMPTQLHGGMSTVQTFIALARSHAVLDLYTFEYDLPIYDYIGIYPISTHSYIKKLNGWDNSHKVDKTDIQAYIEDKYGLLGLTPDEYDAIFLAQTFVEVKWNKDVEEEIRSVKRHKKELKAQKNIEQCDDEIKRLNGLLIR